MTLEGRTVLVTGAGRGFGWGVAVACARAGATVVATDIDEDDLGRALGDLEGLGGQALGFALDVADPEAFEAVARQALASTGRIDALVHSAIYMPLAPLSETSVDDWRRQLEVGLSGLFYGVRAIWGALEGRGGHVVGIASGSSLRGYHHEVPYCALKHGQEGFVKALALEARAHNIAVNTVGPGAPIKTTRLSWAELEALPETEKAAWADPRELGRAIVWLLGQPPARYSGLRFDAGPILAALEREGEDFEPSLDKLTLYPDDFRARQAWFETYSFET